MKKSPLRLGTRKSDLALAQTHWVQQRLRQQGVATTLVPIDSSGDRDRTTPLYESIESTGPGFFTKQLESALLDNSIDLAVHSYKDLPTQLPPGLTLACLPQRVTAQDCLVLSPKAHDTGSTPLPLKKGATLGTSSLRREGLVKSFRPDIEVHPIRGNVPTRIESVRSGRCDAVILAMAGIERLRLTLDDLRVIPLSETQFIPAPAQGALAIETRLDSDFELASALQSLHQIDLAELVEVERKILQELEGGCTLPLGVRCRRDQDGNFEIHAFLGLAQTNRTPHIWKGFYPYQDKGSDPHTLIHRAVAYFREKMA